MGAPAPWPEAATCQLAARNSFAVFAKSSAERRSFSGSLRRISGVLGKHGAHRFQMVHECGHQGFHAFDRNGVGDGFEHVLSIGNRTDQGFGAGAHGVGQLQFTACGGPNGLEAVAVGTLVGGVEFLDGVNFVAEEFDTHRVRCGGREYVRECLRAPRTRHGP